MIELMDNMILCRNDEAHFHLNGYVISKIVAIGLQLTRNSCMRSTVYPKSYILVWAQRKLLAFIFSRTTGKRPLWIQCVTPKCRLNFFFLRFNVDVFMWEKYSFNKIRQHYIQLVPQLKFFVKNSLEVSFCALGTFCGPRSPDLITCEFFLWGYLKSIVYQ